MKKSFVVLSLLLLSSVLSAQSAEKISEIIDSQTVSCEQCAYLAAVYSGLCGENVSYSEAFNTLHENQWISDGTVAQRPVKLSELSRLCVKATGLKCGLLYRITKSDRYAFKELKALGILDASADPSMQVSGQNAISVLNNCIARAEDAE